MEQARLDFKVSEVVLKGAVARTAKKRRKVIDPVAVKQRGIKAGKESARTARIKKAAEKKRKRIGCYANFKN